jgi:hypothetical protein
MSGPIDVLYLMDSASYRRATGELDGEEVLAATRQCHSLSQRPVFPGGGWSGIDRYTKPKAPQFSSLAALIAAGPQRDQATTPDRRPTILTGWKRHWPIYPIRPLTAGEIAIERELNYNHWFNDRAVNRAARDSGRSLMTIGLVATAVVMGILSMALLVTGVGAWATSGEVPTVVAE